jgi:hypothetical protein
LRTPEKASTQQLVERWQEWPTEQRGRVMFVLWVNSLVTLALVGARGSWLAVGAARVWTRRVDGPLVALREGLGWKSLVVLLVASTGHRIGRQYYLRTLLSEAGPSGVST